MKICLIFQLDTLKFIKYLLFIHALHPFTFHSFILSFLHSSIHSFIHPT
eukprot:UN12866